MEIDNTLAAKPLDPKPLEKKLTWYNQKKEDRRNYKKEVREKFFFLKKKNIKNFFVRTVLALVFSALIIGIFWYLMAL
jgi:hypothetical protein